MEVVARRRMSSDIFMIDNISDCCGYFRFRYSF